MQDVMDMAELKMQDAIDAYKAKLQEMKTGKANPAILNQVKVNYYGSNSPIKQVASVSTPDAQTLMIKPFDKSILGELEKAIQLSGLGLSPQNDGTVLRIFFPPLTTDAKKILSKEVKKSAEEIKIGIRNVRREMNEEFKKMEKDGDISEDDLKRELEKSQKATDKYIQILDEMAKNKENSILKI
ncbi:MAG: ribosome recycling factor [Bacilli bacterium]